MPTFEISFSKIFRKLNSFFHLIFVSFFQLTFLVIYQNWTFVFILYFTFLFKSRLYKLSTLIPKSLNFQVLFILISRNLPISLNQIDPMNPKRLQKSLTVQPSEKVIIENLHREYQILDFINVRSICEDE